MSQGAFEGMLDVTTEEHTQGHARERQSQEYAPTIRPQDETLEVDVNTESPELLRETTEDKAGQTQLNHRDGLCVQRTPRYQI